MGRRLIANVIVRDPSTQLPRVFYAGDDVPEWAAKLIGNPTVWSSEDDSEDPPEGDESDADAEEFAPEDAVVIGDTDESIEQDDSEELSEGEEDGTVPAPPPASGRGSGLEAWKRYASAHGVELEDDMSRDDVIAACELAEVPIS